MEPALIGIKFASLDALVEACRELDAGQEISRPGVAAAAYAEIKALLESMERHGIPDLDYCGTDVLALVDASISRWNGGRG